MPEDWSPIALAAATFFGTLVVSLVLVRRGIELAHRFGFVGPPNSVTSDSRGVPLGGGIAFGLVILFASLVLWASNLLPIRIPLTLTAVLVLGVSDDAFTFRPLTKLVGQIVVAIVYILTSDLPLWPMLLTALFLVASQNAWNLVDVMDGLAASISFICLTGCALILTLTSLSPSGTTLLAIAALGAVFGFLRWNWPPASVFMGDAGSLTLGALFGVLVLEVASNNFRAATAMIVTGAIPFFELALLIFERYLKGIPFYKASPDHFSLRLKSHGFSETSILVRVIVAGIVLIAFASPIAFVTERYFLMGGLLLALLITAAILGYRLHSLRKVP